MTSDRRAGDGRPRAVHQGRATAVRRRPGDGRRIALAVALVLVAAGCSGATPVPSPAPSAIQTPTAGSFASPADGAAGPDAVARGPLDPDEQSAYENAVVAEFIGSSGVKAALGDDGWAFVNDLMAKGLTDELAKAGILVGPRQVASISTDLPLTAAGGGGVAGLGLAMASSLVSQALGNPSSPLSGMNATLDSTSEHTANGQRSVAHMTGQIASSLGNGRVTATVGVGVDVAIFDVASGHQVGTVSFHMTGTVELDFCPDASGQVKGHVSMALDGGTTASGTAQMSVQADVVGVVNDGAFLATVDADGSTTEDTTSPSGTVRGSSVSGGFGGPVQSNGSFDPSAMGSHGQVEAETGEPLTNDEATARYERIGGAAGFAIAAISSDAQAQWRGGACVEIHASERSRDVRPREHVQFTATPFHKIEQRDLSKPMVATFAGEASAQPLDTPVPAPALFDYQASPTKDHSGTVTLKSTSNRGIGTLDLTFTTRIGGWKVDHASGNGRITGRQCGDAPGDWDVTGTYEQLGVKGKQRWRITIDANGTTGHYDYLTTSKGKPGGAPVTVFTEGNAKGTVTLTIDPDGNAQMHFKETHHTYRSWTSVGGSGRALPAPLEESDMEWEPDPTC